MGVYKVCSTFEQQSQQRGKCFFNLILEQR